MTECGSVLLLSAGVLHTEQDHCSERRRHARGQTKKGEDVCVWCSWVTVWVRSSRLQNTFHAASVSQSVVPHTSPPSSVSDYWCCAPTCIKALFSPFSHLFPTFVFVCFLGVFSQSAIPVHTRRLSHNPLPSKFPHDADNGTDPQGTFSADSTHLNLVKVKEHEDELVNTRPFCTAASPSAHQMLRADFPWMGCTRNGKQEQLVISVKIRIQHRSIF